MLGETWIVDGANVVGARPDGWWRDRGAAAGRLVDGLGAALDGLYSPGGAGAGFSAPDSVVVVLEGAARAGVPAGRIRDGLVVVHAPGEGDDEIVRQAAAATGPGAVVVVTADRGLRARVAEVGAQFRGPGWLWGLIDPASKRAHGGPR